MTPAPIHLRRGFTLIELIVSVAILLILIFSVGLVFRSASTSVGVSQSVMDMLSNTAAIQQQMASDVGGINKNGFLVIRSTTCTDPVSGFTRRCDQIAFLANGTFPHRGGTTNGVNGNPSSLVDNTFSSDALVWWGQLAMCQPAGVTTDQLNPRTYLTSDQTYKVALDQVPTGQSDSDFVLGRSAILLLTKNTSTGSSTLTGNGGINIATYQNYPIASPTNAAVDYSVASVTAGSSGDEPTKADITQSRVDVAGTFPAQIMQLMEQAVVGARTSANARYEADHFCYRRAALRSPYDTEITSSGVPNFVNGYFRTHTVAMQGVSTFAVEWTDGSLFGANDIDPITNTHLAANSPLINTTRWYGLNNAKCANNAQGVVDPVGLVPTYSANANPVTAPGTTPDLYTAVFSFDNKAQWPVALRFRYHVADPTGRLPAGRDVVQVIKLPS